MSSSVSSTQPSMSSSAVSAQPFDIVTTYKRLLFEDADLTMPVAAIEALVEGLAHSNATTIFETLDLLNSYAEQLKEAIPNHISLSAGTDLFQRYLTSNMGRPDRDFDAIRSHLLNNGRLFVERAKASREKIASFGRHFVRDGATVLTNGGSRVVGALLRSAAEASGGRGSIRFRVIYVFSPPTQRSSHQGEGSDIVTLLRSKGVPVATIPESAVAYSMGKVDMVIVGAEGVVENGGIISRLGTYQMGVLAKAAGKQFYVVAESHKFVRLYPLGQYDLPIKQKVLEFKSGEDGQEEIEDDGKGSGMDEAVELSADNVQSKCSGSSADDAVDFTPPNLISGIITESGVLTPSAVSEELIKIWF